MQAALSRLEQRITEQRAKAAGRVGEEGRRRRRRLPRRERQAGRRADHGQRAAVQGRARRVPAARPARTTPSPCTTAARWWTAASSTARTSAASPPRFPVNGVIPGWTEALQLMKEGAKYQLVIPPIARLRRPRPARRPGAGFDVELIKVGAPTSASRGTHAPCPSSDQRPDRSTTSCAATPPRRRAAGHGPRHAGGPVAGRVRRRP